MDTTEFITPRRSKATSQAQKTPSGAQPTPAADAKIQHLGELAKQHANGQNCLEVPDGLDDEQMLAFWNKVLGR